MRCDTVVAFKVLKTVLKNVLQGNSGNKQYKTTALIGLNIEAGLIRRHFTNGVSGTDD